MNGTYTQRRRRQMAGGGITNARQGYFLGDLVRKIKDDIIPNELKEIASSPVGLAALTAATTKIPGPTQGWLGDLLGTVGENVPILEPITTGMQNVGTGITNLANMIPGVNLPGGSSLSDVDIKKLNELTGGGYFGDVNTTTGQMKFLEAMGVIPSTPSSGLVNYALQQLQGGSNTGAWDTGKWGPKPNWQGPLAIGTTIGLADHLTRSDDKMPAQLAIDPSRFATAEAAKADPLLRFKPQEAYTLKDGGRIGYAGGGIGSLEAGAPDIKYEGDMRTASMENYFQALEMAFKQYQDQGGTMSKEQFFMEFFKKNQVRTPQQSGVMTAAEGGRIGYAGGGILNMLRRLMTPEAKRFKKFEFSGGNLSSDKDMILNDIMEEMSDKIYGKPYGNLNKKQQMKISDAASEELFNIQAAEGDAALDRFKEGWAQGGRIGAQEGGLMDLGGLEKDYREEGGFVPIGGQEKADDVPARLSKNEFVFTADAVRSAGGGDIDEGAAVMENLMNHLEAGGKVSEDSQGLEGAQAMFANTQKLQNRII